MRPRLVSVTTFWLLTITGAVSTFDQKFVVASRGLNCSVELLNGAGHEILTRLGGTLWMDRTVFPSTVVMVTTEFGLDLKTR